MAEPEAEEGNQKSVRFNGVVEVNIRWKKYIFLNSFLSISFHIFKVRELSPNEAVAALMARLSYSASLRAEIASRRCAEKLSALETFKVAATFSLLVGYFYTQCIYIFKVELHYIWLFAVVFR